MAGIAAVLRTDQNPNARAEVQRMTHAMVYRGPDGISHWGNDTVAIGHCRMVTTEEAQEEIQPTVSEDGQIALVIDGYFCNYNNLQHNLIERGAKLRNRSDSELLLRAYQIWGEECLSHVDGEYSFVIWDGRKQKLFCARDHQGLRPLFYKWDGKSLLIASDVKAIIAALKDKPELNLGYLAEVMADEWYTRNETPWKTICRVHPAHFMTVHNGILIEREYWSTPTECTILHKNDEEYVEHYRSLLFDIIRDASRSNSTVGIEVSGGLDSSAIFSVSQVLKHNGMLGAPDAKGFTLAGPQGSGADEVEFARAVAVAAGSELNESNLFTPNFEWFSSQAESDYDLPSYPNGAMALTMHQAMINSGCKSLMVGLGGDEWLRGTRYYYNQLIRLNEFKELLDCIKFDIKSSGMRDTFSNFLRFGLADFIPRQIKSVIRQARKFRGASSLDVDWLAPELKSLLLDRRSAFRESSLLGKNADFRRIKHGFPYLSTMLDNNSRYWARVGLEPRLPMYSRAFIEFSCRTPDHIRKRGQKDRFVHREAMRGLLPEEVRLREGKAEFGLTFTTQNAAVSTYCRAKLKGHFGQLVDQNGLARLFAANQSTKLDHSQLWEIWGTFGAAAMASRLDH